MKTLNQKLIALAAAVVLTTVSLSTVRYNVAAQQATATEINGIKVTVLATVDVQPDAASLRSASLLNYIGVAAFAALPMDSRIGGHAGASRPSLLGSELAMPYYSFGKKFGRTSKE